MTPYSLSAVLRREPDSCAVAAAVPEATVGTNQIRLSHIV